MLRSYQAPRIRAAGLAFVRYIEKQLAERRETPRDDLLTRLALSGELDHEELVSSVFQLVMAGDETTVNLIGNGVLELLRHPAELARLRADPGLDRPGGRGDDAVQRAGRALPAALRADRRGLRRRGDPARRHDHPGAAGRQPATRPSSPIPTCSTSPAPPTGTSASATASTSASGPRWRGSRRGPRSARWFLYGWSWSRPDLEWTPDLFIHGVRRLPLRVGP